LLSLAIACLPSFASKPQFPAAAGFLWVSKAGLARARTALFSSRLQENSEPRLGGILRPMDRQAATHRAKTIGWRSQQEKDKVFAQLSEARHAYEQPKRRATDYPNGRLFVDT
jgi:hypothetical protein